jgi:hypothetical protein
MVNSDETFCVVHLTQNKVHAFKKKIVKSFVQIFEKIYFGGYVPVQQLIPDARVSQ